MFIRTRRVLAFLAYLPRISSAVLLLSTCFLVMAWKCWSVGTQAKAGSRQTGQGVPVLEVGKPIEQELAGGQSRSYQIKLEAGQFARVMAEQRGVDVVLSIYDPNGTKTFEVDSPNGSEGEEFFAMAAAISGIYRIEVAAPDKKAKPGKYILQVSGLRKLTDHESQLPGLLQPIKGELAGGQFHRYQITLRADEYLHLIVEQRSLDVMQAIFDTAGKRLARFDGTNGDSGPESLRFVPNATGTYQLEIRAIEKGAKPGQYELRVGDWRRATVRDRDLTEAEISLHEEGFLRDELKLEEAVPVAKRALELFEKVYGPEHSKVASSLQSLAALHHERGDLAKSEQYFLRELSLREKIYGPKSIWVVRVTYHLANLYLDTGEFARAVQLYQQALDLRKNFSYERLYPNRPALLNSLALAYRNMGSYEKAEPLFQSAQEIFAKLGGPETLERAYVFNNLGVLYHWKGDDEKAEAIYRQALEIMEKSKSSDVTAPLSNLARIYTDKHAYDQAEPLLQRALAIKTNLYGAEGYSTAFTLREVAQMYGAKGDYDKAVSFYQRSIETFQRLLGSEHPDVADSLLGLAKVERDRGNPREAVSLFERGFKIIEKNLRKNLVAGSEQQKLNYLARFTPIINDAVMLHVRHAPNDAQARQMALTSLLCFKGRGLDEMTDTVSFLRLGARQEDRELLERLATARSRLAVLTLRGPGERTMAIYRTLLSQLGDDIERLESELSSKSAEIRARLQSVTLEAVQAAIPAESVVVEFALYSPARSLTKRGNGRYLAYVLSSQGAPSWVELGEAAIIDQAVDRFRQAICRSQTSDSRCRPQSLEETRACARELDELVMRPVRKLLGEARHVLVSPDGALNLVPFAALVDERNRYLTEGYTSVILG